MISKTLKEHLLNRGKNSHLKFSELVACLEYSDFSFIGGTLAGPMGVATHKKAFFDIEMFLDTDDKMVFFVVLHEYCHVLKIERMGMDGMISMLGDDNFETFANHIINEEILADRFGKFMYYIFNNEVFPSYRTQQLDKQHYKDDYEYQIEYLFGKIKDKETYDNMLNSIVLDELD